MAKKKFPETVTLESSAYLEGLFQDFEQQMVRYSALTQHSMGLEARLDLAEKTLCLTRDHLQMALTTTEGGKNFVAKFQRESAKVRFVGKRLTDACAEVLSEHKKMMPEKLLDAINNGTFRFRTNAPLREIHAALMRHPQIRRVGDYYIWIGSKEQKIQGRPIEGEIVKPEKSGVKPN
jgi:hypothetical protein